MSTLNEIWVKKDTLQTILNTLNAKGENGVSLTISISDEAQVKEFNGRTVVQNVSAWVTQTKEQREAKKDRYYVGNGKTIAENGKAKDWNSKPSPKVEDAIVIDDEMPF